MSDDIVTRLRAEGADAMRQHLSLGMHKLCSEAADEIVRLRAAVAARDAALRPFAKTYRIMKARSFSSVAQLTLRGGLAFSTQDFHRAAELVPHEAAA